MSVSVPVAVPTASSDGAPLQVERFGRRYGRSRPWAVRPLTFAVPEGTIRALVGPNGAGKSTLNRACLGFEHPTEGRILVRGVDPQHDSASAIGSIGSVAQSPGLYRGLTIRDHLSFAGAARSSFDREHARAHLAGLGLGTERWVGELSGGEQAQVESAQRARINRPARTKSLTDGPGRKAVNEAALEKEEQEQRREDNDRHTREGEALVGRV
jgi:ABC-2 type transport system ATP-binding protein